MLYLETTDGFSRWTGEAINGVRYPMSIEKHWTTEDLAAIDLYAPAPAAAVPNGKVVTATTVQRIDGVVQFVNTLEDAPVIDWDSVDQDELNRVLAEDGSVVRALAVLTFKQINNLRSNAGLSTFTMEQFISALKAEMRE